MKNNCVCKTCGKKFHSPPSTIKRGYGIFCSRECVYKDFKTSRLKSGSPSWKGGELKRVCIRCGKVFYVPTARVRIGYAKFCGNVCRYKYLRGKKHQSWKGGETLWKYRDAASLKYKNWRNNIFKRDGHKCYLCKDKSTKGHPVRLEAHHLKSWRNYQKLRYTLYNGITLCKECHLSNRVIMED